MPAIGSPLRLTERASQKWLGKNNIVRLPKIHRNLFLSDMSAAKRVTGSNVSKFCVAGRPVSDYMREDHANMHGNFSRQHDLAATQSYVVAADTLAMSQERFDKIFKLAADYIEQTIHDRFTLVHCFAGINRSVTSIIAWWILYGQHNSHSGSGYGSDTSDDDSDSGYDTSDTEGSDGAPHFSHWTQVRDYIRQMNERWRGVPALINPKFEELLHKFNDAYGQKR